MTLIVNYGKACDPTHVGATANFFDQGKQELAYILRKRNQGEG